VYSFYHTGSPDSTVAQMGCSMADKQARDGLGKPYASYGTSLKAILFIVLAVILGLAGGAVLGGANALAWNLAESTDGTPYTIFGWIFIVIGMGIIAYAVYYLGRSFEIRRKGVRYVNRFSVIELRWDEIIMINVHKTTHVDQYGRRTGRIDWDISFEATTGYIHLSPAFLYMVPSVHGMVSLLKMHCGQEIHLPTDF
jgi:hypothetical protein